jgi:hypothetical protein
MKMLAKPKLLFICLLVLTLLSINAYAGSPVDVNLGTAASFGVLGGTTVTNSGNTVINGDLGVWSGTSITGFGPGIVNGTIYAGGAVAQQAQSDVTAAYLSLAGMGVTQDLSGQNLGGKILTSGVYHFSSDAYLTGQLTLNVQNDPNALFVFQIVSALTTAPNSSVIMTNAPEGFCNKYWQVGSSATLGSGTEFMGNILALTSITLNGGTLDGRALARSAKVEITAAETITPSCVIPEPATICLLGLGALSLLRRKRSAWIRQAHHK